MNMIVSDGTQILVSLDDIKHHTNKDPLLQSVIKFIKTNRWNKKDVVYKVRNDLSITDDSAIGVNQIVIPSTL